MMRAVLLAFSISLIFSLLLPSSAIAEPAYYTWVDAQGVVHNTIVEEKKDPESSPSNTNNNSNENAANETVIDGSADRAELKEEFKTEEEYQKDIKQREDKPFYTWTDAEGNIRSDAKPEGFIAFTSTEVVYDAVFAPPFRLPNEISEGVCCSNYEAAFTALLEKNAPLIQKINAKSIPYKTQTNTFPAAYYTLFDTERSIVFIKAFKVEKDERFDIVALNEKFQPLYLASELKGLHVEQTWKDFAYNKIMLEVSDPDVRYLIIFSTNENIDFEKGYSLSVLQGPAGD